MHTLRIAVRRLVRHPGFTLLNTSGLAIGLACALVALFYIRDEIRVDRFHADGDRTFLISLADSGQAAGETWLAYPVADAVAALPGVAGTTRSQPGWKNRLRVPGGEPVEREVRLAERDFFSFFSFPIASGSPQSALDSPDDIVLTQSTARALFGETEAVGQTVEFFQQRWGEPSVWLPLTVTAVALDPPTYTTIGFDAVATFAASPTEQYGDGDSWGMRWLQTYARLEAQVDPQAWAAALPERMADADPGENTWGRQFYQPIPLADAYFVEAEAGGAQFTGQRAFLRLFGLVALAVLVIAILNYVNLATARGLQMAREVGVRKAVGAGRGQVARGLLAEALLLVALAFGAAAALVLLTLPLFNTFFSKSIALGWDALPVWIGALGLMTLVGLLAGAYPALVLSRFDPARVLKSGPHGAVGGSWLRRGLVVTQFAATIGLLVFTGFVFQQIDHVQSRYPLPDDARLAVLDVPEEWATRTPVLKAALSDLPGVRATAAADAVPGRTGMSFGITNDGEPLMMTGIFGDRDYLDVIRLPIAHRAPPRASDAPFGAWVNEATMRQLGQEWAPDVMLPFGLMNGGMSNGISARESAPAAGVLTDFPFESLRKPIEPLFFGEQPDSSDFAFIVAEVASADLAAFQATLPGVWSLFSS